MLKSKDPQTQKYFDRIQRYGLRDKALVIQYGFSVLITSLALFIQYHLRPYTGPLPYFLLYPAFFVVMTFASLGPAILCIIIGALGADYYFIEPLNTFKFFQTNELNATIRFIIFMGSSLSITAINYRKSLAQTKLAQYLATKYEAEEKFRIMANNAPVLLWIANAQNQVTWFNQTWREFTGKLEKDHEKHWLEDIHPEDREEFLLKSTHSFTSRSPFKIEYRLLHHTGLYRWVLISGLPRYLPDGSFEGYIVAGSDIHDQKQAQLELKELTEELRSAVKTRDDFLSIASHELKTPLTSLKLQAQLVKRIIEKNDADSVPKKQVLTHFEKNDQQLSRLTRLVDDMLDVSRIGSGKLRIEYEHFDFCEMVQEVIDRLEDQFLSRSYELPTVEKCGPSFGEWDRFRMEQVVNNLLTNALRYGEGRPISIKVENLGNRLFLKIKDQGIGISAKAQTRIFNRFERAVNSKEISGLGLGLFITRQIIEAHGGDIRVESEEGKGSSFIMQVPFHPSAKAQRPPPIPSIDPHSPSLH